MIVNALLLVVAVVLETYGLAFPWFLVVGYFLLYQHGLSKIVPLLAVGGVLLDVLVPRTLGTSGLLILGIFWVIQALVGNDQRDEPKWFGAGAILVIMEGVWVQREWEQVFLAIIVLGILFFGGRVLRRERGGLIIRREI